MNIYLEFGYRKMQNCLIVFYRTNYLCGQIVSIFWFRTHNIASTTHQNICSKNKYKIIPDIVTSHATKRDTMLTYASLLLRPFNNSTSYYDHKFARRANRFNKVANTLFTQNNPQ